MNMLKFKNSLKGVPSVIWGDYEIKNNEEIDVDLFSNFFNIAINNAFLSCLNCNMLVLDDTTINEYFNEIISLRCIKIYTGKERKHRLGSNTIKVNIDESIYDYCIRLTDNLGCDPILTHKMILKKTPTIKRCRNKILSLDSEMGDGKISPLAAYCKYNDMCPDRLDLMKRLM